MGRMYTVLMDAVSVSAAKDLMRISAPATAALLLHEVKITQDASETSEQLPIQIQRSSTAGTGTAATPEKLDPGDAAASATAATNLTVDTTISGSPLWRESQNVLNGWHYLPTPETRPVLAPSGILAIRLDAPPAAALTLTVVAVIEEIG